MAVVSSGASSAGRGRRSSVLVLRNCEWNICSQSNDGTASLASRHRRERGRYSGCVKELPRAFQERLPHFFVLSYPGVFRFCRFLHPTAVIGTTFACRDNIWLTVCFTHSHYGPVVTSGHHFPIPELRPAVHGRDTTRTHC